MTPASSQLETAIHALLSDDPALTTLLGDHKIYHLPGRNAAFPYTTVATAFSRDWSTGSEAGEDHRLIVTVWAGPHQYDLLQSIMARLADLMADATLALPDHHLVNLRFERRENRLDRRNRARQGILQLRAVTEPKLT